MNGFPRRAALALLPGLLAAGRVDAASAQGPSAEPTPRAVVAVYGDSLAQGVGFMLRQLLLRDPRFRIVNRSRSATAIGQPAHFDWLDAVGTSLRDDRPAIVVAMFGGNDRLAIRGADGRWMRFGSEAWIAQYRQRLEALLDSLAQAGVAVLWCGYPIAREPRFSRDMALLNGIYREAVEARAGLFVETWGWFADAEGRYVETGPDRSGTVRTLRAGDGIHLTAAGYALIAHNLIPLLSDRLERAPRTPPPVREAAPPAAQPPAQPATQPATQPPAQPAAQAAAQPAVSSRLEPGRR